MKKFDEAIDVLKRAVESNPPHVRSEGFYYLGCAYIEVGDREMAELSFRNALAVEVPNEWFQLSSARRLLELQKGGDSNHPLSADDLSLLSWHENRLGQSGRLVSPEIRAAAKIFRANETQYDKYMRRTPSAGDRRLYVLRGWSSAITLIDGSERKWKGGGYFLKWKGRGIVVDPGFDFLRNFHDAGFHASEIDYVIVTHNHPDHNADLKSIDDLQYEVFKRTDSAKGKKYKLYLDDDTRKTQGWASEKAVHRSDTVSLSHGLCNPTGSVTSPNSEFAIKFFEVHHGSDVPFSIGFCLDLLEDNHRVVRVGFTGDTEWFPALPDRLADCDILVAHMSQPSIEELYKTSERKRIHLGYRGLIELVRLAKPSMTLIGEFWAGLEDLRLDLSSGVRELSEQPFVFPTSIGMSVNLTNRKIICSHCGRDVSLDQVRVAAATELYGSLGYYCRSCTLG